MCIHLKTPSKCYHDWTIADHSFKKYKIWSSYIEPFKTTVFISTMKNHGSFLITIVTEMNAFAIQDICNCWVWLIPQSISNCNFWVWLIPRSMPYCNGWVWLFPKSMTHCDCRIWLIPQCMLNFKDWVCLIPQGMPYCNGWVCLIPQGMPYYYCWVINLPYYATISRFVECRDAIPIFIVM